MRLTLFSAAATAVAFSSSAVSAVVINAPSYQISSSTSHRETVQEAAHHARDLVIRRSDGLATFMSVFPEGYGDGLDGLPIGGMEYVAPTDDGDLYILAMPLSKQIHNALESPNHNATLAIKDEVSERKHHQIGGTDRNRMTLFGHLEIIDDETEQREAAKRFAKYHRDAVAYYPGRGPHKALWSRFVVERIYWIGGFGDTHYIGWIPIDMYRNAPTHKNADTTVEKIKERLLIQFEGAF